LFKLLVVVAAAEHATSIAQAVQVVGHTAVSRVDL
jgi:hypothetical protein